MLRFEILLVAILIAILLITQVALPLILNLPCWWLFSRVKQAQITFAFRNALGEKPKNK